MVKETPAQSWLTVWAAIAGPNATMIPSSANESR
jgi:hypothetical protein